jgi:hypothetical protein
VDASTTYDDWTKAWTGESWKLKFPYDFLDSLEKLNYPRLPPKENFYNALKNKGITDEEYTELGQYWEEKGFKNLGDMLFDYL